MNKINPPLLLMICMMMAPQILETLYSPALTAIEIDFAVSPQQAGQTLSVYFIALALGVAFWGRVCDLIGRRTAMLAGLIVYLVGATLALASQTFSLLLLARVVTAFGAAVGSVVTQTMMRDSYRGIELGKVFAIMGIALAFSPVIGMLSGGILTQAGGSRAVFLGQLLLAISLLCWCWQALPETRVSQTAISAPLGSMLYRLLSDSHIWLSALLVALFNIMMFSYYSLAPFIFEQLGFNSQQFGYSGSVLAIGSLLGALLNRRLLQYAISPLTQIGLGALIALLAALLLYWLPTGLILLLPCAMVTTAFGLAIPNILSQALVRYQQQAGTAGALFGLLYYLLIGGGLALAAVGQDLALTLIVCSLLSLTAYICLVIKGLASKRQ